MTRYEYRERIKELKDELKIYKKLVKMLKAGAYLEELTIKAYIDAFDSLVDVAQMEDGINAMSKLNVSLKYINGQYKEHFPELLVDEWIQYFGTI